MKLYTKKTRNPHVFKRYKKSKTRRGVGGNFFTDLVSKIRGNPKPSQSQQSPLNVSSNSDVVAVSQKGTDLGELNLRRLFQGDAFIAYLDKLRETTNVLISMPHGSMVKVFKKLTFKGIKRYVCFNLTQALYQTWMTNTIKPLIVHEPNQAIIQNTQNTILTETLEHITRTTQPDTIRLFNLSSYLNPDIVFFKNKSDVCSVTNNNSDVTEIIKTFIKYFIICFEGVIRFHRENQSAERRRQQNEKIQQIDQQAKQQQVQISAIATAKSNMEEIMEVIQNLAIDFSDKRKQEIEAKKTKLLSALNTNDLDSIKQNTINMILVLSYINLLMQHCTQYRRNNQHARYVSCSQNIADNINVSNSNLDKQNVTDLLTELNTLCAHIKSKSNERSPPLPPVPSPVTTSSVPSPVTSALPPVTSPVPSSVPSSVPSPVTTSVPSPVTSSVLSVSPPPVPPVSSPEEEVKQITQQIDNITDQIGVLLEQKSELIHELTTHNIHNIGGSKKRNRGGSKKTKKKQNK